MSESLEEYAGDTPQESENKSDFIIVSGNILQNIPYKLTILVFITGILVFSDLFVENVLNSLGGCVMNEFPTSKGTVIQLLVLCLALIVFQLLITYGIL